MNQKAEMFQNYLNEREIKAFQVQELEDELGTVVFRSAIEIEGQMLPTVVVLDNTIYGMIRVQVAASAMKEEKAAELVKAVNELNAKYKVFKYYFTPDGSLYLDSCVLSKTDEVDGMMIYTVLDVIIQHLQSEYKEIMKAIWA